MRRPLHRAQGDFTMKQRMTVAFLIAAVLTTTACNTVKGVGRDIESVGRAGEEVINDE